MSEENAPDQCSEQPGDRPEPFLELQGGVISECYTTIDSEEEHRIYVYTHQILEDGSQVTRAHVEHSRGWVEPSHRQLTLEGARELARRDEAIAALLYAFGDELGLKAVRMVIEHNLTARQAYEVVSAFGGDDTLLDMVCRLADLGHPARSICEMVRLAIRTLPPPTDHYTLDGNTPVPCHNLLEWARWYETSDRIVAQTEVNGFRVSTVFLGIDHGWRGTPILFETMVFPDPPTGPIQYRYQTWEQAEEGHSEVIALVESLKNLNACVGCRHYHGQAYNGVMFVCGMYPYGWEGEEKCPDRESSYE